MPETAYMTGEEHEEQPAVDQENEINQEACAMPAFNAVIRNIRPEDGVLATAEVRIGNFCTIRNVKIKEDDYGKQVVMPRTKMPYGTGYKDACFFDSREVREQFDQSVLQAYELVMNPECAYDPELDEELEEADMEEHGLEMEM